MKKHILLLGLAAFITTQTEAQTLMGGPEIGLNLATMSQQINGKKVNTSMLPGIYVGGVLDIGIERNFSIQPGLYFSMKGFRNEYTQTVVLNNVTYTENYEERVRVNYLNIPVNFLYKSDYHSAGRYFIGGGPYVAIAAGGSIEVEKTRSLQTNSDASVLKETATRSLDIGNSRVRDDIKPVDVGLNITGGYEFNNGIFARGTIGVGLANIQPGGDADNSLRNFNIGLGVGYMFGK